MTEMICVVCPRGCHLFVGLTPVPATGDAAGYTVTGNACSRGKEYAIEEILEPKRTVTATCPLEVAPSKSPFRIPVKTTGGILRERIPALMEILMHTRVRLPVRTGDVIIENWENTGVSVVATRGIL